MKYEIKIEFKDNVQLKNVIEKSYFEDGTLGKLVGKKTSLIISENDPLYTLFKGLNNITAKLVNEELIEGSIRCVVSEEEDSVRLFPINNYCIIENNRYSFY
jgi:hypothetical protein